MAPLTQPASFPSLIDATLEQLNDGLEAGLFTSVDLVKAYLSRIEETTPTTNPVTETNPDAVQIAESLDAERSQGKLRGQVLSPLREQRETQLMRQRLLHGIPILIKNNIATHDEMNNTAGSWLLVGAKVPSDSTVAKKLRDAGAILLGKTNMSQWANYRARDPLQPMNGWSAHGGQTYGAYHDKQDPTGSSSGSGVAADLGLALAALGTETDGSILAPASWNNVVGIKPTIGLTSRHLVIPISEHHDTVGPMARTVRDAAAILQVIAGADKHDKYTAAIPPTPPHDYVAACNADALRGVRIGVPWKAINAGKSKNLMHEIAGFQAALTRLEAAGATIVAADYEATGDDVKALERTMFRADFGVNVAQYLSQLSVNPNGITDLASLMAQTRAHPQEDYAQRNIRCWEEVLEQGFDSTDDTGRFGELLAGYEEHGVRRGLPGTLEKHGLDAMLMPASVAARWAAMAAAPGISVPLGFHPANARVCWDKCESLVESGPGVPYGMCFLGRKWSEAKLIGLAYAFEQLSRARAKGVRVVAAPTTEVPIRKL